MKHKNILLIISIFVTQVISYAQYNFPDTSHNVLYILVQKNGEKTTQLKDLLINNSEIKKLTVLDDKQIKDLKLKNEVGIALIVEPYDDVEFLEFSKLLELYNIDKQYWNYKIMFESIYLKEPEKLLASKLFIGNITLNHETKTLKIVKKI